MLRVWLAVAALAASAACSRKPAMETDAAVKQALERYLAARPNLNLQGMELTVSRVVFRGETAEADIAFRAKNDAQATMSLTYTLRRKGGAWEVEPQAAGAAGGPGELPAGHPPVDSPRPPSELPPGHPPVRPQ